MPIPDDIQDKLDSDPNWTVQHEDIVRVMDETPKDKPWSRYMVQQHLDGEPAKGTVLERLKELVELDVLVKYEYSGGFALYDLAYDPMVTDGGSGLRDATIFEILSLRDRESLRDLATGLFYTAIFFFGIGVLTATTSLSTPSISSDSFYITAGIVLYLLSLGILGLVLAVRFVESRLLDRFWSQDITE